MEVRNLDTVPIAVLADSQSERRIEAYLHRQLLPLVRGAGPAGAPPSPLCRLRLARCRVSDAAGNGRSAMPRLLPTPLAVVVVHDEATLPPAMAQLWAGATRSIPDAVCHVRSAAHSSSSAVAASPRLAMWAFVSAVEPAVDTLPSPYGARHRVRAVWLRSTKSAADSASDDSHDADTACLRLWDDQCAVADLLQPVRCRATVAPARSRGRRRKRRDRAASLSPSPWPAPLMDTASRRRPVCYPRATRWACGRPRCRACRPPAARQLLCSNTAQTRSWHAYRCASIRSATGAQRGRRSTSKDLRAPPHAHAHGTCTGGDSRHGDAGLTGAGAGRDRAQGWPGVPLAPRPPRPPALAPVGMDGPRES